MAGIYNTVEELIGNTPIIHLEKIEKAIGSVGKLFAKLECFNPGGSAKDRVARQMLDAAEADGRLNADTVIIEPTSGNTGIGICAIAAVRGYKAIIVMPENMSEERKKLMKAYGAELVLTPAALGMKGAIQRAAELAKEYPNSFIPSQFENPANPEAHRLTTGPEIYRDMGGKVDAFVAGVGTGGTITGVGEYLKGKNKDCYVLAVEPDTSAVLSGEEAGPHKIQGIGAGFIPSILDTKIYDEIFKVSADDAYRFSRMMGTLLGIPVGISSGAALYAASELSKRAEMKDKSIVILLADGGERYLSSELYD